MQPEQLQGTYLDLTTPHVADACMRLGIPVRCAPAGTRPLWSGTHLVGRVCPHGTTAASMCSSKPSKDRILATS